eukprot:CAMPEP_0113531302 /NCGR_PEP_ID=MMETSP0015_2-20120614/3422_1 /TAXON_ID=2838 /ORGANISM="Odontella" /LENGTH=227 /DNA_ID=CAMNT_0000430125 /DNA_START=181 /DNA_END=864 /DNA_ORIENTATION=- /assembly_acc=CAM_ASM_000160
MSDPTPAARTGRRSAAAAALSLLALCLPEGAGAFVSLGGRVPGFGAAADASARGARRGVRVSPAAELMAAAPAPAPAPLGAPASRQKPRRLLKKRRSRRGGKQNRRRDGNSYGQRREEEWQTLEAEGELRPLVRSRSVETGEDYWIDESDLRREREQRRAEATARRKGLVKDGGGGRIPDEKLWEETLAPYRQNWIGYFSVFIVILAMLVTQFPELLQTPTIPIPDL